MFQFTDSLKNYDKKHKQPYSIELEKDDPYDHFNGEVDGERGLGLTFTGCRRYINVPEIATFSLKCNVSHNKNFCAKRSVAWGVVFGYDRRNRTGYELEIKRLPDETGTAIALYRVRLLNRELILENKYDFIQLADVVYPFEMEVSEKAVSCSFAGNSFFCSLSLPKGKIAFFRGEAFREIYLSDLSFQTDEMVPLEEKTYHFVMPKDNGVNTAYKLSLTLTRYEGGYTKVDSLLSGGLWERIREEMIRSTECWAVIEDNITGAYFCLGDSQRYYLFNNTKRILAEGYAQVLTEYDNEWYANLVNDSFDTYRAVADVAKNPVEKTFMLAALPKFENVTMGYDRFSPFAAEFIAGERQCVYDLKGNLLYNGQPLDEQVALDVCSPLSESFAKLIPETVFNREGVIHNLTVNHFFTVEDEVRFTVDLRSNKEMGLFDVKVFLSDAFFVKMRELTAVVGGTARQPFGNPKTWSAEVGKLPLGVYHLTVEINYGRKLIKTHHSAFEVIDPSSEISPQAASGLPSLYASDGALPGLETFLPDFWCTYADYSTMHYFDIVHILPYEAEKGRHWELAPIFKRKTFVWLTQRCLRKEHIKDGSFMDLGVIKHFDYLNMPFPGIIDSRNFYRYDLFEHDLNTNDMLDIFEEYLLAHKDVAEQCGLTDVRTQPIKKENYVEFLKLCSTDYLDYALPKIRALFDKQWAEVKKINPKAKRSSYGPYNNYVSPFVGGYTAKWFGGDPTKWNEMFDGFLQFEDYPFACNYSTTRSAWGVTTIKALCPEVTVYPEIYDSFREGCPDSAIACARPPLGYFKCEPYMNSTQIREYVYNSAIYSPKTGEYTYWRDFGFMLYPMYVFECEKRYSGIVKDWGVTYKNLPKKPKKGMVFVYDIQKTDDRHDGYNNHSYYNISESGLAYVYQHARENGLPVAFYTDFKGLDTVNKDNCDTLVIPSLKGASQEIKDKIRKLYEDGVALVAVSEVNGLEDIFGVKGKRAVKETSSLICGEREEYVSPVNAEYFYKKDTAEVLLKANNGLPVIMKKGNAVLINAPVNQVGRELVKFMIYNGGINISKLLKESLIKALKEVDSPNVSASGKCGVTHFESEKDEEILLLIDYSEMNRNEYSAPTQTVTVTLKGGYKDVVCVSGERAVGKVYENGILVSFTVDVLPQESVLLKLA